MNYDTNEDLWKKVMYAAEERETMDQRPRCTHDGTLKGQEFSCPASFYRDDKGVTRYHPICKYVPRKDVLCLACDADWPAGTTHRCAQPPPKTAAASIGVITGAGQVACCYGMVAGGPHSAGCTNDPSNYRRPEPDEPARDGRAFEAWCATDEGARVLALFLSVNHLPDAQSKLRAVWERYDFAQRN